MFCDVECLPEKGHTGPVEIFLNSVTKSDELIDYFRLSAKERRKRGSLPKKRTGLEQFCLDLAQAADARGFALFHLDDAPSPMVSYITLFKKIRGAEALRPYYDELARRVEQEPALQDELDEVLEELTTPYREFVAPDDKSDDSFQAAVFGIKAPHLPPGTRRYVYYFVSRGYEMVSYLPD